MSQNFNEFDFGQRIKEARQLKHLSQEQLGGLLKVSKATISNYEKNRCRPIPLHFKKLCSILNIDISSVFISENEETFFQKNFFQTNSLYLYYYSNNRLIESLIRIRENSSNNSLECYLFNGVNDFKNYKNCPYSYKGSCVLDKNNIFFNFHNYNNESFDLLENISITAKSPGTQYSSVYACILTGITPNLEPCINKAFFSKNPISDNFEKFDKLLQFDENELDYIRNNKGRFVLRTPDINEYYFTYR